MKGAIMPDLLRFVIIEKDAFIAQDMRMGLDEAAPGCETIVVRNPAQIEGALAPLPASARELVFITANRIQVIEETGLDKLAEKMSGRLVLREGADSNEAVHRRGWLTLGNPFTAEALARMVAALTRHRPG